MDAMFCGDAICSHLSNSITASTRMCADIQLGFAYRFCGSRSEVKA